MLLNPFEESYYNLLESQYQSSSWRLRALLVMYAVPLMAYHGICSESQERFRYTRPARSYCA